MPQTMDIMVRVVLLVLVAVSVATDPTTCVEPCPMAPGEAARIMAQQAKVSARLVARIPKKRLRKLKDERRMNLQRTGEFHDGYVASRILAWAVGAPRAAEGGDVLEIGASTGAGSTSILARALKDEILKGTSPDGRRLLSLEVRAERFLMGEEHRIALEWPSSIMLASTISADDFPATHDPKRPASKEWLRVERTAATTHEVGVLGALCASRRFGVLNVDGGAFTGHAEWAIIRSHCGHARWVALDDTDFKTTMMLDYARAHPDEWEIVYEESVFQENVKGELVKHQNRGKRRTAGDFKAELDALVSSHAGHQHLFRNFALLRNIAAFTVRPEPPVVAPPPPPVVAAPEPEAPEASEAPPPEAPPEALEPESPAEPAETETEEEEVSWETLAIVAAAAVSFLAGRASAWCRRGEAPDEAAAPPPAPRPAAVVEDGELNPFATATARAQGQRRKRRDTSSLNV